MKLPKKYIQILIVIGMSIALLFAGVTVSLAWYISQDKVEANQAMITSKDVEKLEVIVPEMSGDYDKYMGQTGLQYDGVDYPYTIVYTPVSIKANVAESVSSTYLKCYFTESTYIDFVLPTEPDYHLTKEEIANNFTMRMAEVVSDGGEGYTETGTVYVYENGFFRDSVTGEIISLNDGQEHLFSLTIYFIGEAGLRELETTQEDIDDKYLFAFSDERFMFSEFYLYAMYEVGSMRYLQFNSKGYDEEYKVMSDDGITYTGTGIAGMSYTGGSLMDANGVEHDYPIPELFANGSTAYNKYFMDWFYWAYDEEAGADKPRIYRENDDVTNGVYSLQLSNIIENNATFHAKWANSMKITFDANYENAPKLGETYVRPQSNYYKGAGYLEYNKDTKEISVYNPSQGQDVALINTIPAPTRDGYVFLGWATTPDATYDNASGTISTGAFNAGNQYKLAYGEDITLYAVWRESVKITIAVEDAWGDGYATLSNGKVTFYGSNVAVSNGVAIIDALSGEDLFTQLKNITATAMATINVTGEVRELTLKGWADEKGNLITESSTYALTENLTIYPVWNERNTYTITIDLYQTWLSSDACGLASVSSAVILDGYKVLFNGQETIEFVGDENTNLVITNIAEGCSISQFNMTIEFEDGSFGVSNMSNPYRCLMLEDNSISGTLISFKYNEYLESTFITEDKIIYAFFYIGA